MKMPTIEVYLLAEKFHAQLSLARKSVRLLVSLDLLAGKISCSAELSMKKVFYPRGLNRTRNRRWQISSGKCLI